MMVHFQIIANISSFADNYVVVRCQLHERFILQVLYNTCLKSVKY